MSLLIGIDTATRLHAPQCDTCLDVAWLLDAGELAPRVLERMGASRGSLVTHLRRHDRALHARFLNANYSDIALLKPGAPVPRQRRAAQ